MLNSTDIKVVLLEMQQQLSQRQQALTADIHHVGSPVSADFEDQAQETENDEVAYSLLASTELELQLVTNALKRLEQNRYGVCTQCGETIGEKRLQAIPYAELCLDCAEQL